MTDRMALLQREISFRQAEIGKLKSEISQRQGETASANVASNANLQRTSDLEHSLLAKENLIRQKDNDLVRIKSDYDKMLMTRLSEGTAQMQIEAYRTENQKLLGMLAQTKEFKHFAECALDSGDVRFMSPSQPSTARTSTADPNEKSEEWIPQDAFKVAHDFRNKCAANISKAMMNTLLTDLDKIWRQREDRKLQR